jgi:transposase
VEKRHEQLKTVFEVMPVNLKSPNRIEAFFFIYFLAVLVESLIEREIRRSMKKERR